MTSATQMCNMALGQLSRPTISDIDTVEDSEEWRQCNRFYTMARDFVMEDVWWGFAKQYRELSLLSEEPREWLYMYAKPSDALAIRYLLPNYTVNTSNDDVTIIPEYLERPVREWPREVPYEIMLSSAGDEVIVTSEVDAYACITKRITDTTKFSAQFVNGFQYYLASLLAFPLKVPEAAKAQSAMLKAYQTAIASAARNDFNQRRNQQRADSDITLARM